MIPFRRLHFFPKIWKHYIMIIEDSEEIYENSDSEVFL